MIIAKNSHPTPGGCFTLVSDDLAEVDRRLNNPLTNLWSLTFQNNTLGQDTLQAKG
jgi:hypothetical protein